MAKVVREVIAWLNTLDPDSQVHIDEDGVYLQSVDDEDTYFEVGGYEDDEDDPDDDGF
jgi:hypothetical protein